MTQHDGRVLTVEQAATPAELSAIMDDIEVLERQSHKRVLLRGALAGVNINQMGPAGTGKSLLAREFCKRITGARFFTKALHALMVPDSLFGGVDIPALVDGRFEINVTNKMPDAHIAFVDEWSRANGPTMDGLLPMLNAGEREAEGANGMFRTPLLFVVLASNFTPPADDPQFGALVDRITLSQWIEYVKADSSFRDLVSGHLARRAGGAGMVVRASVTLEQFMLAQASVAQVAPTDGFLADFGQLRRKARQAGVGISDRAWGELAQVCQAEAFMNGRTELVSTDLAACEDGLWRDEADRGAARDLVMPYLSEVLSAATERRRETEPALARLYEQKPIIEGLPVGARVPDGAISDVQSAARELGVAYGRIAKLLKTAEAEQVSVPDLNELQSELVGANEWLEDNFLPTFIN
jgi:MoxR-like ATPase